MSLTKCPTCFLCGDLITDDLFFAISSVKQNNKNLQSWNNEKGWIRKHSNYYHEECFVAVAGENHRNKVANPELEEKDHKKMQTLAGIK